MTQDQTVPPWTSYSFSIVCTGNVSHLRLVEVDDDLQVGGPVVEPLGGGRPRRGLQLRGEAGLQPLRARHHLDLLHPLFAEAKHLAAEILHLLVIYGIEFVETWRRKARLEMRDATLTVTASPGDVFMLYEPDAVKHQSRKLHFLMCMNMYFQRDK